MALAAGGGSAGGGAAGGGRLAAARVAAVRQAAVRQSASAGLADAGSAGGKQAKMSAKRAQLGAPRPLLVKCAARAGWAYAPLLSQGLLWMCTCSAEADIAAGAHHRGGHEGRRAHLV